MKTKILISINIGLTLLILVLLSVANVQASSQKNADLAQNSNQTQSDSIPVGLVIDWWRPSESFPLPDEYMICNGSAISDATSPINGQTLPDLGSRYTRGLTDLNTIPALGYTSGGSATHTHTANPEHTHYMSWHHGTTTVTTDPTNQYTLYWGIGITSYTLPYYDHTHEYSFSMGGGGNTGDSNYGIQTTSSTPYQPAYVGLLKLCKVK